MITNRLSFAGNAGKDAEIRETQSGKKVCSISLCNTRKDQNGNEYPTWIKVTAWDWKAEYLSNARKGDQVYVEGPLSVNEWQDKDGDTRVSVEVNAFEVAIVSKFKKENNDNYGRGQTQQRIHESNPANNPSLDDIPF